MICEPTARYDHEETALETVPLTLMISWRSTDKIVYQGNLQPLGVLCEDMKAKLEKITIGGRQVVKVWIHEDESNASALINNWDECLDKRGMRTSLVDLPPCARRRHSKDHKPR